MATTLQEHLRRITKVDALLEWPELLRLRERHGRQTLIAAVRATLDQLRSELRAGVIAELPGRPELAERISSELQRFSASSLRPLINGTGIVIHTNLGRAPLADAAAEAVRQIACCYSNLEFDLESGQRGSRHSHVEELICQLTGAEAALVVNNNAAAVILALSALAAGREAIVSRGEQVEIGGSFRIPDVMRQSGVALVEVGTTNCTHLRDYQAAIGEDTGLLLKIHTSNFAMIGFTAEAGIAELSGLARQNGIPLMLDAGSGCLADLAPYGITGEPTIRQYLASGTDLVTFSGDKLLGGPQAGIIAGSRALVEPMKRHPLLRAFRIDKLTLAALEATLRIYRDERQAVREIPVLRMLTAQQADLIRRTDRLKKRLQRVLPATVTITRHLGESGVGGGSFPLLRLPTALLEVAIAGASPDRLGEVLRRTTPAVIGRIQQDRFLVDLRTLGEEDTTGLICALQTAAAVISGASV